MDLNFWKNLQAAWCKRLDAETEASITAAALHLAAEISTSGYTSPYSKNILDDLDFDDEDDDDDY